MSGRRLYDLVRSFARILVRKDQQAVGNRVLHTIISISDKRNQLVELPADDFDRGVALQRDQQTVCTSQASTLQVLT